MRRIILLVTVAVVVALMVVMSASPAMAKKFPPGANCGHDSEGFFTVPANADIIDPVHKHDCEPGTRG